MMKVRIKTLKQLMKIDGIEFRSTGNIFNSKCKERSFIPDTLHEFIGKEIEVVRMYGTYLGCYDYQYDDGPYLSNWMLDLPVPETTVGGNKVTIRDNNLHVGCQIIKLDDARLIAKFMKENT
jgi:hypothetical protein